MRTQSPPPLSCPAWLVQPCALAGSAVVRPLRSLAALSRTAQPTNKRRCQPPTRSSSPGCCSSQPHTTHTAQHITAVQHATPLQSGELTGGRLTG